MSVGRMSGLRLFVQDSGYTSQIRIAAGPFAAMEIYADFTLLLPRRGTRAAAIAFYRTVMGWGLSANGKDPAAVSPGGGHRGAC
jgi:hypothetical protein